MLVALPTQARGPALSCPLRWGEPGKPLVTTPVTAKAIFLAVEKDFFPQADAKGFPAVDANDKGDHWEVFRWRPGVLGGGQLELSIAKCDGAISDVHLSR